METPPTRLTTPDGLVLSRLTTEPEIRGLLHLFANIASEQGWQPGDYLTSYPETAQHIALIRDREIIGGLQAVLPNAEGKLPCHHVWPEVSLPKACAHVTIIGLKPTFRGRVELFWALCQDLWCLCADHKISTMVLEATPRMLTLYQRMGLPLKVVGELREHWGEPCYLTSVETIAVAGSVVIRARYSEVFRRLVLDALQPDAASAIVEATNGVAALA